MGMPGSETALEELMRRVLGYFLKEGIVSKIEDDLYCGGTTEAELLHNWRRALHALDECDMCLSASKTAIYFLSTFFFIQVYFMPLQFIHLVLNRLCFSPRVE